MNGDRKLVIHTGILFNLRKEGNDIALSHSFLEFKKLNLRKHIVK